MSRGALRSLNQYLPPQMRLTSTNITSAGLWGGTAALGAIWLVQPFGYLRSLMGGSPAEEEGEQASGGQPSPPAPEKEGEDDGGKQEGGKAEAREQEGGGDEKDS